MWTVLPKVKYNKNTLNLRFDNLNSKNSVIKQQSRLSIYTYRRHVVKKKGMTNHLYKQTDDMSSLITIRRQVVYIL